MASMASIESIDVKKGNIVMTFNTEGKLLGLGKVNVDTTPSVQVEKALTGEINLGVTASDQDKYKKTLAKALLSTSFKETYNKDEGVIVKLKAKSVDEYLYIPGIIAANVDSGGKADVIVGDGKTMTEVPLENIRSNYKLKENESGFFFSDTELANTLGGKTYSNITDDDLKTIIKEDNYKKFSIPSLGASIITKDVATNKEYYIRHNAFTIGSTKKTIGANDRVSTKSVVPMGFNMVNDIENPNFIELTTDSNINEQNVVFGGKQSKKQKTRKNTMPLQYAPGAKRAYLKRRKSSRK